MANMTMLSGADFRPDFIHATGGLLALLAAMTLSVLKPWGKTPYGRRTSQAYSPPRPSGEAMPPREPVFVTGRPRWGHVVGIHATHAVVIGLLFAAFLHLTGMHHH